MSASNVIVFYVTVSTSKSPSFFYSIANGMRQG